MVHDVRHDHRVLLRREEGRYSTARGEKHHEGDDEPSTTTALGVGGLDVGSGPRKYGHRLGFLTRRDNAHGLRGVSAEERTTRP